MVEWTKVGEKQIHLATAQPQGTSQTLGNNGKYVVIGLVAIGLAIAYLMSRRKA